MYNYRLTVHPNGKFLFRTDWIDTEYVAKEVAAALCRQFGSANVTVFRRNAIMQSAKGLDLFDAE